MGKLYKGGLVVGRNKARSRSFSIRDVMIGFLEIINKVAPLALLFGALLIMSYLKKNDLSGIFLTAISSPQGLIAFSIGSIFVVLTAVISLLLPPLFAAAIKVTGKGFSPVVTLDAQWWFVGYIFCAIVFILLPIAEPLFLVSRVIAAIAMLCLLFWYQWKKGMAQLGAATMIIVLCLFGASVPILVIANGAEFYKQSEIYVLIFWFAYLLISGLLVTAVFNGKNIKDFVVLAMLGGGLGIVVLVQYSDFVSDRAARLLELRHDDLRWYWVSKDAVSKFVPEELMVFSERGENYIHAKSKFSLGDVRVLCVPRSSNKEAKKSDEPQVGEDSCLILDKSEVRRVDSIHFDNLK